MNRRGFLSLIGAGAAVALAPGELWVPGQKTFFLPPKTGWDFKYVIGELAPMNFYIENIKSYHEFQRQLLQDIADGLGVSYEQLLEKWP